MDLQWFGLKVLQSLSFSSRHFLSSPWIRCSIPNNFKIWSVHKLIANICWWHNRLWLLWISKLISPKIAVARTTSLLRRRQSSNGLAQHMLVPISIFIQCMNLMPPVFYINHSPITALRLNRSLLPELALVSLTHAKIHDLRNRHERIQTCSGDISWKIRNKPTTLV